MTRLPVSLFSDFGHVFSYCDLLASRSMLCAFLTFFVLFQALSLPVLLFFSTDPNLPSYETSLNPTSHPRSLLDHLCHDDLLTHLNPCSDIPPPGLQSRMPLTCPVLPPNIDLGGELTASAHGHLGQKGTSGQQCPGQN